jgi:hypothetical protein
MVTEVVEYVVNSCTTNTNSISNLFAGPSKLEKPVDLKASTRRETARSKLRARWIRSVESRQGGDTLWAIHARKSRYYNTKKTSV